MNNLTPQTVEEMLEELAKIRVTPDNRIYWGSASGDAWGMYANVAATTNSWEMKVDFHD